MIQKRDGVVRASQQKDPQIAIVNMTSLEAARIFSASGLSDVLVLNFADAKTPGGLWQESYF